jgi:hypothetical protein
MGVLYDNCQRCGHLLSKYSITYCDRCLTEIEKERIERIDKREAVYDRMIRNGMSDEDIEEVDNTINSYFLIYIFHPILFAIFFPSEIEELDSTLNKYIVGFCAWMLLLFALFLITKLNGYDNKIINNGSTEFEKKYIEISLKIMNPIILIMFIKAICGLFY